MMVDEEKKKGEEKREKGKGKKGKGGKKKNNELNLIFLWAVPESCRRKYLSQTVRKLDGFQIYVLPIKGL